MVNLRTILEIFSDARYIFFYGRSDLSRLLCVPLRTSVRLICRGVWRILGYMGRNFFLARSALKYSWRPR